MTAPNAGDGAPSEGPRLGSLLLLGSLGAGCIAAGIGLGYALDVVAGTTPLFLFLGLTLGIVSACAGAYRIVRDYLKQ